MKTLIRFFGFAVCSSFLWGSFASAHPGDDLPLTSIGVGTKLVVRQDLNIPANATGLTFELGDEGLMDWRMRYRWVHVFVDDTDAITVRTEDGQACWFRLSEVKNVDRVLRKGSVITITGFEKNRTAVDTFRYERRIRNEADVVYLKTDRNLTLGCVDAAYISLKATPRISTLKVNTEGYFQVVYPDPEEI